MKMLNDNSKPNVVVDKQSSLISDLEMKTLLSKNDRK